MDDARFEDGANADRPLRLNAVSEDDLSVLSTLLQDSVGKAGEISWMPRRRRFAVLLNRFRWEDKTAAERQNRSYERVRAALLIDSVLSVKTRGLDPRDKEMTYALLRVEFEPGEDGAGRLLLVLAGDGDIALDVECVDIRLADLTKPWQAKASAPDHGLSEAGE
ncbi:MAG: DUF2948 family protein [Pseudomonadota bacterium]